MLSRFSIQQRLYSVPAIIAVLLLSMVAFILWQVNGIVADGRIQSQYRSLAFQGAIARGDMANLRKFEKDLMLGARNPATVKDYFKKWNEQHTVFLVTLREMLKLAEAESDKKEINVMIEEAGEYKRSIEALHVLLTSEKGVTPAEAKESFDPVRERVKTVFERTEAKVYEYEKAAEERAKISQGKVDLVVNSVVGICLAILAIGVLLTLFIARSILKPLQIITERVEGVAKGDGDLRLRVGLQSTDELGRLGSALDLFLESTGTIVRDVLVTVKATVDVAMQLSEASQTLSSGSEEMSQQTQSMAAAASQLHQNLEVVSSSIEEMSISVADIAKRSVDAANVANEANSRTGTTNDIVRELGQNARQIGKVIESIVDIADQTNLLALNAAIEAADAGDTGKRFAVVASEVKELARQTGESSEEIKSRIETIQGSVEQTVQAIDSITQVIQKVNEVNQAIASFVEEQSIAAQEVSRNASMAASVSTEVARNVNGVSTVVTEGAGEATRVASLAQRLNDMATHLQSALSRFKV